MLLTLFLYLSILSSCDKDDIVALEQVDQTEQENEDEDQNEDSYSLEVVDDAFSINSGSTEVLDVLQNDAISSATALKLKLLTKPNYGDVEIKEDNTIEYIAQETPVDIVDQIAYAIETYDNNGNLISDSGDITITVMGDTDLIQENNLLFTEKARHLLKQRFENGYNAGAGFDDDISKVISKASEFLANPSANRPIFGGASSSVPNGGHYLHTTAVYAYAIEDKTMANAVAAELLAIVNANNLSTTYWNNSSSLRWDSAPGALWIQCTKAKKMKDSYNFIKDFQTVLSTTDKAAIKEWFGRFADLSFNAISNRINKFLGEGWSVNNLTGKYYTGDEFGVNSEGSYTGRPVQDGQGNDLYVMAMPQDIYNNRNFDVIAWVHSWAVEAGDLAKETYCRDFFKLFFKYGVFPDGTIWELKRNNTAAPFQGVAYGDTTMEAAIQMAHKDAMGGHFVGDLLYDYTTTDGVLNGSTTISTSAYRGTSTTDGVTPKGLLVLMKAQSKYLRTKSNGGWNDVRFYVDTNNNYHPLDCTGKIMPSAHIAMANLYYKDKDLEDWYRYRSSAGYPSKQSIYAGYNGGAWNKDSGSWGNMIFGAMWYGQEDNFF